MGLNGIYSVGVLCGMQVYCEMGLNGGGYTFIRPQDWAALDGEELQAIFTDRTSLLARAKCNDYTQPYAVLEQLPEYQSV